MSFTMTAFSSALFSTWVYVEQLGILFDAGDGVCATLAQKSRSIRHVFVTHADRDHVCGLLQLHQLNARNGSPSIHYPKDCGSFPALREFMERFDPLSGPATWNGIRDGDSIEVGKELSVLARTSAHVASDDSMTKALDYVVRRAKRSLRPEFRRLSGSEIAEMRRSRGDDAVSQVEVQNLLGYSGDCPALDPARWADTRILLHECTFLQPETARREHSNLAQVIEAASGLSLEALVLLHFSTRFSAAEITEAIATEAAKYELSFPVFAVLPGVVSRDVLATAPVWSPK